MTAGSVFSSVMVCVSARFWSVMDSETAPVGLMNGTVTLTRVCISLEDNKLHIFVIVYRVGPLRTLLFSILFFCVKSPLKASW